MCVVLASENKWRVEALPTWKNSKVITFVLEDEFYMPILTEEFMFLSVNGNGEKEQFIDFFRGKGVILSSGHQESVAKLIEDGQEILRQVE